MRNRLFALLTGLLLSSTLHAQEEVYSSSGKPLNRSEKQIKSDKLIDPDRFIIGGWGLFGFGTGILNLGASPIVGYRITEKFSAGIGFGYQYLRLNPDYQYSVILDPVSGYSEYRPSNTHIYSPNVWARHIIWNNIFAHVEYEHVIASQTYFTNDFTQYATLPIIKESKSLTIPCLLVGGGLRQPIGERTSIVVMVLYDVLQDKQSPYRNNIALRFGINAGF